MDIIESGYRYRVYDMKGENPQDITFTRRTSGGFESGTTNEEIVDVLIARMYSLNAGKPTPENQCVIILLKAIRQLLSRIVTKKIERNDKKNNKDTQEKEQGISVHQGDEQRDAG
jgi:hypothetical protein